MMLVERPYTVSDESEEEETNVNELFNQVKREYEQGIEHINDTFTLCDKQSYDSTSSSSSSSSSSSESSSESEIEPEECVQSRAFIEHLSFNPCISPYEMTRLITAPRSTKRTKKTVKCDEPSDVDGLELLKASEEDRITIEDRRRTAQRIEAKDAYVDVMIENYVFVSYFCNKQGDKYRLALRELAILLLGYGIQYSKNKFTKLTIKYLLGPSHYLFGSGVLVESGTYSEMIAYKSHYHSMRILAERCQHENILVKKRKCQNIVAKGTLPFGLCLVLLKHKYPNYVSYEGEDFAGAIIRPGNMTNDHEEKSDRHHSSSSDYSHEEDDETNESSRYSGDASQRSNEEDESNDSGYEYLEKSCHDKKTCHPAFDYYIVVDKEQRLRNEVLLKKQEDESEYKVLEKKPLKQKELLELHNAEDLDDYQISALTQKKKVTILAFLKGCIICAGCKSDREVYETYAKVLPMLSSCRDNEINKAAEAELIKKGFY